MYYREFMYIRNMLPEAIQFWDDPKARATIIKSMHRKWLEQRLEISPPANCYWLVWQLRRVLSKTAGDNRYYADANGVRSRKDTFEYYRELGVILGIEHGNRSL